MANAVENEVSLLEAIKVSIGSYSIMPQISQLIFPYTSYILKNVIKFRLDGLEEIDTVAGSDESAITEFDFIKFDFEGISIILKEIENASSAEMDEHKFALSLPSVLGKMNYSMNFILVGTLASFAVSHGVWLLVLSFISADSSKEDIMIVLKRVEGLFITLRRNLDKQEDKNHLDFYLYISLLSSSVTRMPNANWVTRGVFSCSSVCRNLPKNGYIIHDPLNLEYIREKLVSILERLQMLYVIGKRYMEDEKLVNAYQILNKGGKDNYFVLMALFGLQPGESEEIKLSHCSKKKIDVSLTTLRHKTLVLIISGGMANAVEDKVSLLEAIKESLGSYSIKPKISQLIYPYTSYILKNVIKFRLDGLKEIDTVADSDESAITEFDFIKIDFEDISKILKEIEKASSAEMDEHKFALSLPSVLDKMNYNMNFILVGTLASFAVSHGVWLLVLSFISADSSKEDIMIVLKRVEGLFITLRRNLDKQEDKNHLDFYLYISLLSSSVTRMARANWESMGSLYNLTKAMFKVTSAAHMFLKDVSQFIPKSMKNEFDDLMLLSIYWVSRGVFCCYSECRNLPKNGYIIHDPLNLEYIREKLVPILERLQILDGLGKCYMEDEMLVNAYQILNKGGKDNYFALMALFGLQPSESEEVKLSHCSKKKIDVSLTMLRHKTLVLIISGLNISSHLIDLLQDIYEKFMTSLQRKNCEFIWLPINSDSWNTSLEEQFTKLVQMMPWYTVQHPTISEETKRFIRVKWKFHRKPIVVVLNEDGNVVCPNAIHIMCLWGAKAYPFTRFRERSLWINEWPLYPGSTFLMHLILGFDHPISNLYSRLDYVIIYGGNDAAWIQKFTTCIRGASDDSGTSLVSICIPKNEEIRETISTLFEDKQPQIHILLNSKQIWYFWTRLESFLISRYLSIDASEYSRDPITQKVKELLCYSSIESWACLIEPSSKGFMMIHSLGNVMLQAFMEPNVRTQLPSKDFTKTLHNYIEHLREAQAEDYPCSRIVLNIDNTDAVQLSMCPHCNQFMEKKIQYRCCHVDDELA